MSDKKSVPRSLSLSLRGDLLAEARKNDPVLDRLAAAAFEAEEARAETRSLQTIRTIDRSRVEVLTAFEQASPGSRPFLLAPQALTLCPLPYKATPDRLAQRNCALPGGHPLRVDYAAVRRDAGLAYGADAVLLDLLAGYARRRGTPSVSFATAADIMTAMRLEDRGGEGYRTLYQRLRRLRGLHISISRPDVGAAINVRVAEVDGLSGDDPHGAPKILAERAGQARLWPYAITFSPEFWADLMEWSLRIPEVVPKAFGNSPLQYNLAKWLLWRAAYAQTDSLIPWGLLAEERAAGYGRVRDFRVVVRGVLDILAAGLPPVRRAFRVVPRGLKILALDELKRLLKA